MLPVIAGQFRFGTRVASSGPKCAKPISRAWGSYFAASLAGLILFRPQHLSGFQVDNVHLRARQARD